MRVSSVTIIEYLERKPKIAHIAVGVFLFLVVTILKYHSGPEVVFSAIYLVPVSFITWFGSTTAGVLTATASVVSLLLINLSDAHKYLHAAIPYWNASMDFGVFLLVILLLSQTKKLYRREREFSREDFVTGLHNKRAFLEALTQEVIRTRRYQHSLTIAYVDLDNFKHMNDCYGHTTGDMLLSIVGSVMRNSVREVDFVARLGGDEFALVLLETDNVAAQSVLATLQNRLQQAMAVHQWPVTFTIGALTFDDPPASAQEMIEMADQVMYSAKRSGKNRIVHHVIALH